MGADEKLANLNSTLGDIESRLTYRALERSRADAERGYDFVNRAVEAGFAEIDCGNAEVDDSEVELDDEAAAMDGDVSDGDGGDPE